MAYDLPSIQRKGGCTPFREQEGNINVCIHPYPFTDTGRHPDRRTCRSALVSLLLVLGGSPLIAASAQIAFRLPFSPVPITGQTFAVLMVGMVWGLASGPWR